jgi:ATP-dependent Clp protease ATP-binding subunit ClpC
VDLPLSNECKRVLAYAAEEAERLSHKHIGTEHLLLGLLREEKCFAAEILHERGLRLSTIREELARSSQEKAQPQRQRESSLLGEFSRDLTQAAMDTQLDPLVGREGELERVVQILCRRTKNNPVLIGEPGVGKTAIVEGLAQRIADGEVPSVTYRCRHQVSWPVRRTAEDHHEGIDGVAECHHFHRRTAHFGWRRFGRRVAGCR